VSQTEHFKNVLFWVREVGGARARAKGELPPPRHLGGAAHGVIAYWCWVCACYQQSERPCHSSTRHKLCSITVARQTGSISRLHHSINGAAWPRHLQSDRVNTRSAFPLAHGHTTFNIATVTSWPSAWAPDTTSFSDAAHNAFVPAGLGQCWFPARRQTKEKFDRDCGKRLSGMWIEQGGCHGS